MLPWASAFSVPRIANVLMVPGQILSQRSLTLCSAFRVSSLPEAMSRPKGKGVAYRQTFTPSGVRVSGLTRILSADHDLVAVVDRRPHGWLVR